MATTFEALSERTTSFGKNAYLEVSRKRMREGHEESEFLVVSRGYVERDGSKRWTKFLTIPNDPALRSWLADAVREV